MRPRLVAAKMTNKDAIHARIHSRLSRSSKLTVRPIWAERQRRWRSAAVSIDQPQQRSNNEAHPNLLSVLSWRSCCDWLSAQSRSVRAACHAPGTSFQFSCESVAQPSPSRTAAQPRCARSGRRQATILFTAKAKGCQARIPRMARARLPAASRRTWTDTVRHLSARGFISQFVALGVGTSLN